MVTSHRSNQGKPAFKRWHAERQRARHEAMSDEEFSDEQVVRFDLDNDDPLYPARIYGDENPETFITIGEDGERHDIRNDPRH